MSSKISKNEIADGNFIFSDYKNAIFVKNGLKSIINVEGGTLNLTK